MHVTRTQVTFHLSTLISDCLVFSGFRNTEPFSVPVTHKRWMAPVYSPSPPAPWCEGVDNKVWSWDDEKIFLTDDAGSVTTSTPLYGEGIHFRLRIILQIMFSNRRTDHKAPQQGWWPSGLDKTLDPLLICSFNRYSIYVGWRNKHLLCARFSAKAGNTTVKKTKRGSCRHGMQSGGKTTLTE